MPTGNRSGRGQPNEQPPPARSVPARTKRSRPSDAVPQQIRLGRSGVRRVLRPALSVQASSQPASLLEHQLSYNVAWTQDLPHLSRAEWEHRRVGESVEEVAFTWKTVTFNKTLVSRTRVVSPVGTPASLPFGNGRRAGVRPRQPENGRSSNRPQEGLQDGGQAGRSPLAADPWPAAPPSLLVGQGRDPDSGHPKAAGASPPGDHDALPHAHRRLLRGRARVS